MYIDVLPACMSVCGCRIPWIWSLQTVVNLEEQPVLLTAKPSLQHLILLFIVPVS